MASEVGDPGPIPGPVQEELLVRLDQAMNEVSYCQRVEAGDSSPMTDTEFRLWAIASLEYLRDAVIQLAAEIDGLRMGERL